MILTIPSWHDGNVLRYYQANDYKWDKTKPCVEAYNVWRKDYLPVECSQKIIDTLKSGLIYHFGRDNRFRPIIVMRTKLLSESDLTNEEIKLTLAYFIEYMLENAILPGQVENWVTITDMTGVGLTNVPYSVRFHLYKSPNF